MNEWSGSSGRHGGAGRHGGWGGASWFGTDPRTWASPPWGPGGSGPGQGWPFGPGSSRPRASKGDVRSAILALLMEGPRHGYQLIQEITDRSGGAWRPSPGSIYPALAALQDEGLIDDEKLEGRRVYALTTAGRVHVQERADELSGVFNVFYDEGAERPGDGPEREDFAKLLFGVGAAGVQVARTGTAEQVDAARRLLSNARRDLYRLLADESEDSRG